MVAQVAPADFGARHTGRKLRLIMGLMDEAHSTERRHRELSPRVLGAHERVAPMLRAPGCQCRPKNSRRISNSHDLCMAKQPL